MYSVSKIPTPCYLYDTDALTRNVESLQAAMRSLYRNYKIAYSYKTNNSNVVCRYLNNIGVMAEVVSKYEYWMAQRFGASPKDIIFNGVTVDLDTKARAARNGAIVNLDNVEEFKEFAELVGDKPLEVGIRLNFDIGNGVLSRFGVDTENQNEMAYLLDIKSHPNLTIRSVHFHIGDARGVEYFRKRIVKMIHFAELFGADIIDIGGNMAGPVFSEYREQFSQPLPSFEEYASVIGSEMRKAYPDQHKTLITENGTSLVANTIHLLTTIKAVKTIRGQVFITTDAKHGDVGSVCDFKNPSYQHFGNENNFVSKAIVNGCTCIEKDRLIHDYNGFANVGDKILILGCGAYSYSMNGNFIKPMCDDFMALQNTDIQIVKHL